VAGLAACGIEVTGMAPLPVEPTRENLRYLTAKRDRLGHQIENILVPNGHVVPAPAILPATGERVG